MRVLWQMFSDASAPSLTPTMAELRARDVEIEISAQPQRDLANFALAHFFELAPLTQTLRGVLNALSQHKAYVVTFTAAPQTTIGAPTNEIAQHTRAFEHAAQEFILNHAARVLKNFSAESYAQTYRELIPVHTNNPLAENSLRALEDTLIEMTRLIQRADAYYYSELTPRLERDAQSARALEQELLQSKRK